MRHLHSSPFSSVLRALALTGSLGALVVFSGCQPQKSAPTPEQRRAAEPFLAHVVQFQGETLSILAGWYTGSAKNWELLRDANPGLNPNRIRLGDTIQIPRELVTREDPLPRSALPGGQKKGASSAATPERNSRPQDDQRGNTAAPVVEREVQEDNRDAVSGAAEQAQAAADQAAQDAASQDAASQDTGTMTNDAASQSGSLSDAGSESAPDASGSDAVAPDAAVEVAPSQPETKPEMRIKSRDELLKELLEE